MSKKDKGPKTDAVLTDDQLDAKKARKKAKKAAKKLAATHTLAATPSEQPASAPVAPLDAADELSQIRRDIAALGGLTRTSRETPEERSARMSNLARISHQRRRERREAGIPEPVNKPRKRSSAMATPSLEALRPFLDELIRNPAYAEASELDLRRQALVMYRHELARARVDGRKK
jgi:hypothetical protein